MSNGAWVTSTDFPSLFQYFSSYCELFELGLILSHVVCIGLLELFQSSVLFYSKRAKLLVSDLAYKELRSHHSNQTIKS